MGIRLNLCGYRSRATVRRHAARAIVFRFAKPNRR
jgi:hypothetical protein